MAKRIVTDNMIKDYCEEMYQNEMSSDTIKKYFCYLDLFRKYAGGKSVSKESVIVWKDTLREQFSSTTANSALAAPNDLSKWFNWGDCMIRLIKVKHRMFCSGQRGLLREEYIRLVNAACGGGNERSSPLLQTVCSTEIRISGPNFIITNAVDKQVAEVNCKGKIRTVFLAGGLCRFLKVYAGKRNIISDTIFVIRNGKPMDRSNIWREMKQISHKAEVNPGKVFPHSLRHSFARMYYSQEEDSVRLADVLRYSSINTTRICTTESGGDHLRQLEKMDLLIDRYNKIPLLL